MVQLEFNRTNTLLGCQNADKTLELFLIRDEEELKKKLARKKKRQREKLRKTSSGDAVDAADVPADGACL